MKTVSSIGEINGEVASRCAALGLPYHCGSDGIFNAKIAIVSDYPGEREKATKQPLIGRAGGVLWDNLRPLNINRRSVYVTNAIKRQVLRGDGDDKADVSSGEAEHYGSILQWELSQLPNLEYILILGGYALAALTGLMGISHHRGSLYDIELQSPSSQIKRRVRAFVMNNPAMVIHKPETSIIFKFDVGKFKNVINGQFKQHSIQAIINPSPEEAKLYIERMRDEKLPVALDIESIAGETACIGLANNAHSGMCINFRDGSSNLFSVREEYDLRLRLQRFVSDKDVKLVMQNGMFDSYWLACKDRIMLGASYFDTMLAHHTLYPTLPHNLGFLTSQYTTHPFYKDDGKFWKEGGDINSFWEYNVKDCCITFACYEAMIKELQMQKLDSFFFEHVMRLQPHLIRMVVGGVKVDRPLKDKIAMEMKDEVKRLLDEFHRHVEICTGDDRYKPNPGSPKQLRKLLFEDLRLVGRGIATDAKNRARMRNHPKTTHEQRQLLLSIDKYAKEKKFASTYAEMVIDEDDRARTEYKQTGVQSAPGRLSSTSVMWGSGANLQNQPARAQKMFLADEGYELNYFDLSQAEARVVALRAVIPQWIADFERARLEGGFDAHRSLAATMFKVPYDEVPTEDWEEDEVTPTIRYKAKRCRHGLNYTMGGPELAEQIGVDVNEGLTLHNIYHKVNPELERWWNWTYEQVRTGRTLFNAYGRRYINLAPLSPNLLGTLVAFYPQSTIGDKVSRCIYLCEDDPEWPKDARMLLNIHDALIAINRPEDGDVVRRIMKKYAEEPLMIEGIDGVTRELIIPCDLKTSTKTIVRVDGTLEEHEDGKHRWAGMKKVKLAA